MGSIYDDNSVFPDLVGAAVQEVVRQAKALGLSWTLRPATVSLSTAGTTSVVMDGDTSPISVTNLSGSPLAPEQRVYVLITPPSGNFVFGFVGQSQTFIGTVVGWAVASGIGPFVTVETAALTTGNITFKAGSAYELDFEIDVEGSVAENFANIQIRRTSGAGTVIRANSGHPMSSLAGFGTTCKGTGIVLNTASVDISDPIVLTLSSPMAGAVRITGATNRLAYLRATYLGAAADYPGATTL